MTIERVYADHQQIVIGYILVGPVGRKYFGGSGRGVKFSLTTPTLTDAQGHLFPFISQHFGDSVGNAEGRVIVFDASTVMAKVSSYTPTLHLVVPAIQMNEFNSVKKHSCETYTKANAVARTVTIWGPLLYNFKVHTAYTRIAYSYATVKVRGVIIKIEKAEITPINTRVYVRISTKAGKALFAAFSELTVPQQVYGIVNRDHLQLVSYVHDGQIRDQGNPPVLYSGYPALQAFDSDAPLYSYHGKVTVYFYSQSRLASVAITFDTSLERVHKPPTCPPHVLIDPRIRWCHPHTILRPPAVTRRSAPAPAPFLRVSNRTRVAGASSGGPRNHRCGPRWVENETWELGGLWTRS